MERGYVIGAGAQGRVVAETWRTARPGLSLAFVDDDPALRERLGVPVVGPVSSLSVVDWEVSEVVVGLGDNPRRLALGEEWAARGARFGVVVHPNATVMRSASVGPGSVVFAGAVVNTEARVGRHVIVNTGAIVEHDCVLEDGASIGPGARMAGRIVIGRCAFISAGVTLAPFCRVGAGSIVGAGSVVASDLPAGVLALGVPARVVRPLVEADWVRVFSPPRRPKDGT